MKVGILTHYNVNNQGAQLQMLAMKSWLEEQGHQVVILTYEKNFDFDRSEEKRNSGSIANFPYYIRHFLLEKGPGLTAFNTRKVLVHRRAFQHLHTEPYDSDNLDCIIIGSDEVFSIDVGCNRMMYGHGLKAPAIAYAPAFGRTTEALLKEYDCYELVRSGLSDLFRLSARDSHTKDMIEHMTGREVPLVCDPVLLYSGEAFRVPVKPIGKPYMIVYSYDRHMVDPDEVRAVKTYAKKHDLLTVSLGTYHAWCDRNIVCDAREWYSYFADAECVLTDTFHGSIAAMKNHCRAAFFIRKSINAFKMESLLETAGLQEQRLDALTAAQMEKAFSKEIDYAEVDRRLRRLAESSEIYLLNALKDVEQERMEQFRDCRNISVPSRYVCSGCGACTSLCAKDAVHLRMDDAGFYAAVVDESKCVQCGLCQRVCSRYQSEVRGVDLRETTLFALQSVDHRVVRNCSSGGIAHELSVQALKKNRKVIGVVYDAVGDRAEHRIVDAVECIGTLDGSKYLQSHPETAFREALLDTQKDESSSYLVFGTPCQIAGLDAACRLKGVRDQFLLAELFCHGVPSYKLWEEECRRIRQKIGEGPFDSVQFRYKKTDWHSYCLRATSHNRIFYGTRESELFWQVFFENILLGDSCYQCRFRKEISAADLRLGDYWGRRYRNRSDGVSAVFACTDRGRNAVEDLLNQDRLVQMDPGDTAEMLAAQNMAGYTQLKLHEDAMRALRSDGLLKAVRVSRQGMSRKQKTKRVLLNLSSVIPGPLKKQLRRVRSGRSMTP